MQSTCSDGQIQLTASVAVIAKELEVPMESRGEIFVKGKGRSKHSESGSVAAQAQAGHELIFPTS